MKLRSLIAIFGTLALLSGCKNPPSVYHVHTKYRFDKADVFGQEHIIENRTDTFYYTPDGKRDYKNSDTRIVEERKGNIDEWKTFDKTGKLITSTVHFYDEKGLEDSFVTKDATHVTYAHKYIYDANGYMIEDRQYSPQPPAIVFKYKVVDGNTLEEKMTNSPASDTVQTPDPKTGKMETKIITYDNFIVHKEYYLDKPNFPRNENFGFTNPDRHSRNLEKKAVQLSDKGDTLEVYWFRYQFDDKGRVTSAAQIARSGAEYDSTAYTYY